MYTAGSGRKLIQALKGWFIDYIDITPNNDFFMAEVFLDRKKDFMIKESIRRWPFPA